MISYAKPDQRWIFYEIDPAVLKIARNRKFFTFLSQSPAPFQVILGDARLSLKGACDHDFDMIVLDAFGSDAVPVHLLTSEAMDLYLKKLDGNGIVVFHVSSRYLDLEPVLARLAESRGLRALLREDHSSDRDLRDGKFTSSWAVFCRNPRDIADFARDPRWKKLKKSERVKLWTDDDSNLLGIFSWD
jgi:spermidine synthase